MTKELLLIPGPVNVSAAVLSAAARPMIDHRGPAFAALLGRITDALRPLFGTISDVVLLGGSGTSGLEAAVASQFGPGDRLLAAPVGLFGRRLVKIAQTYGCEVDVLETPGGAAVDPNALRERLAADRERRFVGLLLTQNETSTGVQNDMAALSDALGDHPAIVVVDAVSGLGASRFAMDDWRFDVVVGASQKVLAAPPGLTMLALSERAWKRAETVRGPRFALDVSRARDFARLGQTPWTPPVSIAFALDAALDAFAREDAPNVWLRHKRYAEAIRAGVRALDLALYSKPDAHSNTVVAIGVPEGIDAAGVTRALREKHGVVIGGGQQDLKGKIFRIGTMGDLRDADILGALGAFELALHEWGHAPIDPGAAARAAVKSFADSAPPLATGEASDAMAVEEQP